MLDTPNCKTRVLYLTSGTTTVKSPFAMHTFYWKTKGSLTLLTLDQPPHHLIHSKLSTDLDILQKPSKPPDSQCIF